MISSVYVVYKLHAYRNIAFVYIAAVQSLFLRSFVLFTICLYSTPENVENKIKSHFL